MFDSLPGNNCPATDLIHDDDGMESNNRRNRSNTTTAEGPRTMISVREKESIGLSYPWSRDAAGIFSFSEET